MKNFGGVVTLLVDFLFSKMCHPENRALEARQVVEGLAPGEWFNAKYEERCFFFCFAEVALLEDVFLKTGDLFILTFKRKSDRL